MVDQAVKRTERLSGRIAPRYPDVEKPDQKPGQLTQIELEIVLQLFRGATWKRGIDLKIAEPEILCEIPVQLFRATFTTARMEHANHPTPNPSAFHPNK